MRFHAGLCGFVLAGLCLSAGAPARAEGFSASESLKDILGGNETYRKNETLAKRREAIAQTQTPQAIVLSCSDSRVPPEAVFNRYLGRLFVVRTAGHVIGDIELGSIEYAVEHLKVPLLVVMGHERCGAVKATVEAVKAAGGEPGDEAAPAEHGKEGKEDKSEEERGKHHHADRRSPYGTNDLAGACAQHKKPADEDKADDKADDKAAHAKKAKGKAKKVEKADADADADEKSEDKPEHGKKAKKAEKADDDDADEKPHAKKAEKAEEADDEDAEKPEPKHAVEHVAAPAHDHIGALVTALTPAVREAMTHKPQDLVDEAVRVNTLRVAHELPERSAVIKEAVEAGKLKIVGARYDLDTGAVDLLE